MIADLVTNAQEAAHAAISNGWDTLEQASLFVRKLPYLIPDALNEFNRNITGFPYGPDHLIVKGKAKAA